MRTLYDSDSFWTVCRMEHMWLSLGLITSCEVSSIGVVYGFMDFTKVLNNERKI